MHILGPEVLQLFGPKRRIVWCVKVLLTFCPMFGVGGASTSGIFSFFISFNCQYTYNILVDPKCSLYSNHGFAILTEYYGLTVPFTGLLVIRYLSTKASSASESSDSSSGVKSNASGCSAASKLTICTLGSRIISCSVSLRSAKHHFIGIHLDN